MAFFTSKENHYARGGATLMSVRIVGSFWTAKLIQAGDRKLQHTNRGPSLVLIRPPTDNILVRKPVRKRRVSHCSPN
jgi:hypothetical protein